jgi:hypothetical protein
MKKLLMIGLLLVQVKGYAQQIPRNEFVCDYQNGAKPILFITMDGEFYSNVIEFEDWKFENFKKLLNEDEMNLNIKEIKFSTAARVGNCNEISESNRILECRMPGDDGWIGGTIKFNYFKGSDLITVERRLKIDILNLNILKEDAAAVLDVKAKFHINNKEVDYTLKRQVGSVGDANSDCKFQH